VWDDLLRLSGAPASETQDQPNLVDFQTGPNTRVVQVVLRRRQSGKLNNQLMGTVWIDNLSLTPLAD
jgi:hypothetical protein